MFLKLLEKLGKKRVVLDRGPHIQDLIWLNHG